MAQIIQEIKVELSKPNFFQAIVAKQYDSGSRFLKVNFVHENEKISIEGPAEVCINAKRSDGEKKSFEGQVNDDGTATVPLAYWMLELVGTVNCDISVLSGESRLTTTNFILEVEEASNIPGDVSKDENYDVLLSLIERVEKVEKTESTDNKVTNIGKDSTDEQYPSAKAVFDLFSTVEAPGDDTAKCECVGFDGAFTVTPKYKPFTRIINNCQNTADWNTHSLSNCETDAENYVLGNQSIHSTNGAMVCMKNTYDMLNNSLVLKLRINSIATGANLYLQIFNTATPSKSVVYNLMRGTSTTPVGEWREIAVPYTGYSWGSFDSVDFSNINYLRIYAEGDVDWNLQFVGTRPIVLDKGIVTFTFDDGYASQGTGLKILAEKGITGTLFYIPESNSNGSDDYLKISDLQNLSNYYGTDIEVHGESSYNDKTNEELIAHWQEAQALLKGNGLGEGRYMSYPNNMHENRVVQLAKGFFDGCRTIQYYIPSETYPPADNYRVRAISSISSAPNSNNVANIKNHIDRAMASKSWLILTFHRIEDGNTSMYCSESELSEIADYAIASGAYIMNYAEVMESSVANKCLGKE